VPKCSFDDIKRAVPGLTSAQKLELVQICKATAQFTKAEPVTEPLELDPADWLTDAIGRKLVEMGQASSYGSALHIMRNAASPAYYENSRHVRKWLLAAVGDDLSHNDKMRLGDTVVRVLVTWLRRIPNFPGIGPKVLLSNVRNIPRALDAELPGYMGKGMMRVLIRSKNQLKLRE
jgi:hypothetical protein